MLGNNSSTAHSSSDGPWAATAKKAARLAAIDATSILDTPAEEAFDRITRIAAAVSECQMATISIVTQDREFLKSTWGIGEPWASERTLPLSQSVAVEAVAAAEPVVVGDRRVPLTTRSAQRCFDPRVMAHVAVPLITNDSHAIGALSVLDTRPRLWTEQDVTLLQDLGAITMAQIMLQQSRTTFREFAETMSAAVVLVEDGRFRFVNTAALAMTGYTREQLLDRDVVGLAAAESRALIQRRLEARRAGEEVPARFELKIRTNFGEDLWADVSVGLLHFEGRPAVIASAVDITDRKQVESQLRALFNRLEAVREEERTRLSREIHDVLGQALTGLKIDLSHLADRLARSTFVDEDQMIGKTRSMVKLVDKTIDAVRTLATELRPGVLDHLGLSAAVSWQLEDFQARTGIECRLQTDLEVADVGAQRSTAIFRICQEALTNVARHAQATMVTVDLKADAAGVTLKVTDNGIGIPPDKIQSDSSLGVLGMRERVMALAGRLQIGRGPEGGTTVVVWIPLAMPNAPHPAGSR